MVFGSLNKIKKIKRQMLYAFNSKDNRPQSVDAAIYGNALFLKPGEISAE